MRAVEWLFMAGKGRHAMPGECNFSALAHLNGGNLGVSMQMVAHP